MDVYIFYKISWIVFFVSLVHLDSHIAVVAYLFCHILNTHVISCTTEKRYIFTATISDGASVEED